MKRTTAWACVLGVAVAANVGCSSSKKDEAATTQPSTASTVVVTTAVATTAAPATTASPTSTTRAVLSSASRLDVDSLGPVKVGIAMSALLAAAGVPMTTSVGPFCTTATPTGGPAGVAFVATAPATDKLAVITLNLASPVRTTTGVGLGSTEAEVLAAYGGRAATVNSVGPTRRVVVRSGDNSMVFSIQNSKVVVIIAGARAEAELDELCA